MLLARFISFKYHTRSSKRERSTLSRKYILAAKLAFTIVSDGEQSITRRCTYGCFSSFLAVITNCRITISLVIVVTGVVPLEIRLTAFWMLASGMHPISRLLFKTVNCLLLAVIVGMFSSVFMMCCRARLMFSVFGVLSRLVAYDWRVFLVFLSHCPTSGLGAVSVFSPVCVQFGVRMLVTTRPFVLRMSVAFLVCNSRVSSHAITTSQVVPSYII